MAAVGPSVAGEENALRSIVMTRIFAVICAVMTVALAGCAASGPVEGTSTSSRVAVSSSDTATSSVPAAASSVSAAASAAPIDGSGGWYDTWGWVSPQTAGRALAAGIAPGKDVRDELRCGTACGESPTAAEIQAQYILDHPESPNATLKAYESAAAACPGFFIRGNCYADAEAARAAGEGE